MELLDKRDPIPNCMALSVAKEINTQILNRKRKYKGLME